MDRDSVVLDVEVQHEGGIYSASYFVEGGTIHANVGGRTLMAPRGGIAPAETVRRLLKGYLLQQSRKFAQADHWSKRVGLTAVR